MSAKVLLSILFWSARILNVLVLSFVLFFFLAHLFGNSEEGNGFTEFIEVAMFFFFPIGTLIGLLIAWKWEFIGGLITFSSIIVIFLLQKDLIESVYFIVFGLTGLLHVLHAKLKSYLVP